MCFNNRLKIKLAWLKRSSSSCRDKNRDSFDGGDSVGNDDENDDDGSGSEYDDDDDDGRCNDTYILIIYTLGIARTSLSRLPWTRIRSRSIAHERRSPPATARALAGAWPAAASRSENDRQGRAWDNGAETIKKSVTRHLLQGSDGSPNCVQRVAIAVYLEITDEKSTRNRLQSHGKLGAGALTLAIQSFTPAARNTAFTCTASAIVDTADPVAAVTAVSSSQRHQYDIPQQHYVTRTTTITQTAITLDPATIPLPLRAANSCTIVAPSLA